jgi:hypothetical protein
MPWSLLVSTEITALFSFILQGFPDAADFPDYLQDQITRDESPLAGATRSLPARSDHVP